MSDLLVDIETLSLKCRPGRAREYVNEAILCYRGGAYRSTIVNSWIAVVFDLVDKVRELALNGDAAALAINGQYEAYLAQIEAGNEQGVKSALNFERTILNTCRDKLELFDHQQLKDLLRLREDRHQCAHPSFQRPGEPYRPSAEQARLHLRNVVDHVLSQPPVQGRSAILALEADVASNYFPKDVAHAITVLKASPLENPNEALIKGYVDRLIFGYGTSTSPLFEKIQVATALDAVMEIHRARAEERIQEKLNKLIRDVTDGGMPSVALLTATMVSGPMMLHEPSKIRLMEFVKRAPLEQVRPTMTGLARQSDICAAIDMRVNECDATQLGEVISAGVKLSSVKSKALEFLSEVGSYNSANSRFAKLIYPIFDVLLRADIERIIRMPKETKADLVGATAYEQFIKDVRQKSIFAEAELNELLTANNASYLVPQED